MIIVTTLAHPFTQDHQIAPSPVIPKMGKLVKLNLSQHGRREPFGVEARLPVMGNGLRHLRKARGWTIDQAAAAMGMSFGGYMKLERGERRLKADQIARAAVAFEVLELDVLKVRTDLHIEGEVLSSGIVRIFPDAVACTIVAPPPEGTTSSTHVYVVKEGNALPGIADGGWLIYFDDPISTVPDEWIGKVCVCELQTGDKVVRRVFYSKEVGKFDLLIPGSEVDRAVSLLSVAIVTWTKQPI